MKNLFKSMLLIYVFAAFLLGCVKDDFDKPPTDGIDPMLTVTTTIAQLKAMHTFGQFETIGDDLIIKGIIVADDASGNWYRTFVLQDETGGIPVLTDQRSSYVSFPIGREVYVKCKGLVLGDYNNLIQLGGFVSLDNSLGPIADVTGHLIKSVRKDPPAPKTKLINELTLDDVSTLIRLENVQFATTDTAFTFADAINQIALNRNLEDCNNRKVLVRTSGFATFAGANVPNGNGSFTGVLSVFRSDFQFLIRDLDDLSLNGPRCGGGGGGNPCDGSNPVTVTGLDENFESGTDNQPVAINGWTNVAVKGSRTWLYRDFGGNTYAQATAFNDAAAEMETWLVSPLINLTEPLKLTFETAKSFYTHAGLTAWVSTDFICNPVEATWQPLPATIAGQSNADNAFISSGEIDLAPLVGQKIAIGFKYVGSGPNGLTGTFRLDNIKLGTGGGPVDPCAGNPPAVVGALNESFSGGSNDAAVAINGWANFTAKGTRNWIYKVFSGNTYVQATAFNDTSSEMETWLITPLIDVTGAKTLSFETAKAFWTHNGLSVLISENYTCEPLAATWAPLTAIIAGQSNPDHDWIPSGNIDLSPYIGKKVAIAFKYVGSGPGGQTTSYRVDNLMVQ